jgi:hypothetical protein
MEYEESYYGHRIVVTTSKTVSDAWTASAALPDDGDDIALVGGEETYRSEDEARDAALSAAAQAIDRARSSQGKP